MERGRPCIRPTVVEVSCRGRSLSPQPASPKDDVVEFSSSKKLLGISVPRRSCSLDCDDTNHSCCSIFSDNEDFVVQAESTRLLLVMVCETSIAANDTPSPTLKVKKQLDSESSLFRSNTISSENQQSTTKNKVNFNTVQIHFHETIMGDSPACSAGIPIGIGWRRSSSIALTVDDFEHTRPSQPRKNRQLKIPSSHRERILREAGYKLSQIQRHMDILEALKVDQENSHPTITTRAQSRSNAYPAPKLLTFFSRTRHGKTVKG